MSKNIEINIQTASNTYETLYPLTLSDIVHLSESLKSSLELNNNSSIDNAFETIKNLIPSEKIYFEYGYRIGAGDSKITLKNFDRNVSTKIAFQHNPIVVIQTENIDEITLGFEGGWDTGIPGIELLNNIMMFLAIRETSFSRVGTILYSYPTENSIKMIFERENNTLYWYPTSINASIQSNLQSMAFNKLNYYYSYIGITSET